MLQSHWLNQCLHHLHQVCILLKGLAVGVCKNSMCMWWNWPQGRKENPVLVLLEEDSFLVAIFLFLCYNGSASIIDNSSAPALTAFLQWRTKYSMDFLQFILHLSVLDLVHISAASLLGGCFYGGTGVSLI